MKKRLIIASIAGGALILVFVIILFISKLTGNKPSFTFTKAEKGDIKTTVSCTGTIEPQKIVQVGTQVSGTISKLYADYNYKVRKGELLAVLDTKLLDIAVKSAEADLLKATTQYELNLKDYENNIELNKEKLISDFDLGKIKVTKDSAYASKLQAEANLLKAETNLDYAIIRAPIDGTVIEKNVEEGQTVAASLSAPTLFTIAEDLSNIQIQALVSESDIGQIKENQKALFTVTAYDEEEFSGIVEEIHLNPTVSSNVVNYTVIINAQNKNNMLLPGMTATVDFIIEEKKDVILVPNTVIKFKPTAAMLKSVKKQRDDKKFSMNDPSSDATSDAAEDKTKFKDRANADNKSRQKSFSQDNAKNSSDKNLKKNKNIAQIWYMDKDNKIKFIMVRTGLTDGQKTEILGRREIDLNANFISGYETKKTDKTSQNRNIPMRRIF